MTIFTYTIGLFLNQQFVGRDNSVIANNTEARNKLTPYLFEAISFLKSNRELYEYSQELISHEISMNKIEKLAHIYEWKKMRQKKLQ